MWGVPKPLFWGLVAGSAILAVWLGASPAFKRDGDAPLFYGAFVPCLVAFMIAGVVSTVQNERESILKMSTPGFPYRTGWFILIMEGVIAPLIVGLLASFVEVSVIALLAQAILG